MACVSASRRLMPREARDRGTREARVSRRTRRKAEKRQDGASWSVDPGGYASLDCLCRDINSPSSSPGDNATRSPRPIKRLWPSLTGTCPSQDVSLAGTCPSQGRVPHRDVSAHQAAIKDVLTVCRSASTQDHEKIRTRFGWFACAGAPQRGQHRDLPPPKPGHCTPHLACRTRPSAHTRVNTR